MKKIIFYTYHGGLTDPYFSSEIMICADKNSCSQLLFDWDEMKEEIKTFDDLLLFIRDSDEISTECKRNISRNCIYILKDNMLYLADRNKSVEELFRFVESGLLQLYLFIVGGASINIECGYKLMIHTDEDVHKNTPHVHVIKGDENVRYLLETLERVKTDKCSHDIIRDEKKIILPGIKKNLRELWDMWGAYNGGYIPPIIDFQGKQYYSES